MRTRNRSAHGRTSRGSPTCKATKTPPLSGVGHYDEERVLPGINLYVTGGGPNAFLIDLNGNQLHKWSVPFDDAFPNYDRKRDIGAKYWRYAHLYEDGSLVVVFTRHGILKIDRFWKQRVGKGTKPPWQEKHPRETRIVSAYPIQSRRNAEPPTLS